MLFQSRWKNNTVLSYEVSKEKSIRTAERHDGCKQGPLICQKAMVVPVEVITAGMLICLPLHVSVWTADVAKVTFSLAVMSFWSHSRDGLTVMNQQHDNKDSVTAVVLNV